MPLEKLFKAGDIHDLIVHRFAAVDRKDLGFLLRGSLDRRLSRRSLSLYRRHGIGGDDEMYDTIMANRNKGINECLPFHSLISFSDNAFAFRIVAFAMKISANTFVPSIIMAKLNIFGDLFDGKKADVMKNAIATFLQNHLGGDVGALTTSVIQKTAHIP